MQLKKKTSLFTASHSIQVIQAINIPQSTTYFFCFKNFSLPQDDLIQKQYENRNQNENKRKSN